MTDSRNGSSAESTSEIVRLIEVLRADEGDSVTILCDNPDFNGQPNCAIECCGDWTGWLHKRFAADTLLDTLSMAVTERNLPSPRKVIATSNGHHWVQRFNLVCCRDCGFVRRADDQNKPCKGPVGVGLRRDLIPDVAQPEQEPVGYQFRQRSGVGKGPQSSAPWCDWCAIDRETYEKYQREPNKLVHVRQVFAAPVPQCSAGNDDEAAAKLINQYLGMSDIDAEDAAYFRAVMRDTRTEPQRAKESERSAALEPFIKKMDWPLGGLPDTDIIQCRVVTPNFTTGGDQKASFGLTVADFRKLREAFQPGGTLKERTQWVADILEDASSPLTRPAPHTAANPLSFDDRDEYIDELEAQIERLRSPQAPHEPRKP